MSNTRIVDTPFSRDMCEQIFAVHVAGVPFDMHHYAAVIPSGGDGGWCKKGVIWDQRK